jgi:hypothetical protein
MRYIKNNAAGLGFIQPAGTHIMKRILTFAICTLLAQATALWAAPLGFAARTIIPSEVQQIISVDYRTMKNSPTALALKQRIMPENLKQFEASIKSFGLDPEKDIDQLSFVAFRTKDHALMAVGIAEGQFPTQAVLKRLKLKKIAPTRYRQTDLYPASGGMQMALLDQSTMLFGDAAAIRVALDTRDGELPSLNSNNQVAGLMAGIEREPVWSVLDSAGTQVMMRNALGDAAQLNAYDNLKKHLTGSRYIMNFANGVTFDLDVVTTDNFTASSLSSLVKAGVMYRKMSASGVEKVALDSVKVDSDSEKLQLHFKTDDDKFESLLRSDLFAAVAR